MTVVVDEESIVVANLMVRPLAIAMSVAVLAIGYVTAQMLLAAVLADSRPSLVAAMVVAGETVFLDQIGLVIVTWMIVMMVAAVMGTVIKLTQETGMLGAVIVMPMIATPLVAITLVLIGMEELQIVTCQVGMAGSEKEAMREMEFVVVAAAVAAMIGVAQGAVEAMTGMAQGVPWVVAMTGMVHVVVVLLIDMAAEDLRAMREEVTGRGLGLMIASAGVEGVSMIATDKLSVDSSSLSCSFL